MILFRSNAAKVIFIFFSFIFYIFLFGISDGCLPKEWKERKSMFFDPPLKLCVKEFLWLTYTDRLHICKSIYIVAIRNFRKVIFNERENAYEMEKRKKHIRKTHKRNAFACHLPVSMEQIFFFCFVFLSFSNENLLIIWIPFYSLFTISYIKIRIDSSTHTYINTHSVTAMHVRTPWLINK